MQQHWENHIGVITNTPAAVTTDSVHVFLLESVHLFSLTLNAESTQKALRALFGHMMCVADWLMPMRHNRQEGTTACECTWIGGER